MDMSNSRSIHKILEQKQALIPDQYKKTLEAKALMYYMHNIGIIIRTTSYRRCITKEINYNKRYKKCRCLKNRISDISTKFNWKSRSNKIQKMSILRIMIKWSTSKSSDSSKKEKKSSGWSRNYLIKIPGSEILTSRSRWRK